MIKKALAFFVWTLFILCNKVVAQDKPFLLIPSIFYSSYKTQPTTRAQKLPGNIGGMIEVRKEIFEKKNYTFYVGGLLGTVVLYSRHLFTKLQVALFLIHFFMNII